MKMEDIKPVSKCECGHLERDHFPNKKYSGHARLVCWYCRYDGKCYSFIPSIPHPEKEDDCDLERPMTKQEAAIAEDLGKFLDEPQTPEWGKEFEKKIGHDDWCKTLKYPKSSWDCNCYMKDSLTFISKLLEGAREDEGLKYRKDGWILERDINEAEQRGYERGRSNYQQRAEPINILLAVEQAKTEERERIKSLIEEKAREKFMSADEWYEYILTLIEA